MNYRQLLKKYINHVEAAEGSSFLSKRHRSAYQDMPDFTDEEWEKLVQLQQEPLAISPETHVCSCHEKNRGPCHICKELGCLVWDFNEVARPLHL